MPFILAKVEHFICIGLCQLKVDVGNATKNYVADILIISLL